MSFYTRLKGLFAVELVLVIATMFLALFFLTQIGVNFAIKGHMDSISYSIANSVRERLQFYKGGGGKIKNLDSSQVDELYDAASIVLSQGMKTFNKNNFSVTIEEFSPNENQYLIYSENSTACTPKKPLYEKNTNILSPVLSNGRRSLLYRVTTCYKGSFFFNRYLGLPDGEHISSESITLGPFPTEMQQSDPRSRPDHPGRDHELKKFISG